MIFTIIQLIIALSLLIVETVIAIAVHSHFAQPLETIKTWFLSHRRLSLRVILPALLVLNFSMAVLFSFTLGTRQKSTVSSHTEAQGIAQDLFETLPELRTQPQQPSESQETKKEQTEEPRILIGRPADSTLNTNIQTDDTPNKGNPSFDEAPADMQ
ncbi:hypothetical protein [Marispirochaeta sp.]|uniref:hypothetical protein n=1 Tax=Marispirochaeta sp. TaxID=2038653 RepID=UPI0029C7C7EB|nr:hypothetical protein [Marispirochaeta sp.]